MLLPQRLAILVDSENLEITVEQNYKPPKRQARTHKVYPDWRKIIPLVTAGRTLVRNIYYKKRGLRVSEKFEKMWSREFGGEIKRPMKSADPYIAIDAVTLCDKVDTVILLAGDKDFLPLVWYLKSRGCKVEMASFEAAAAQILQNAADYFYMLDKSHSVVIPRSRV